MAELTPAEKAAATKAANQLAAEAAAALEVEVFGTGNFIIGETLYAFRQTTDRDGKFVNDKVAAKNEDHAKLLEAESKRREKVYATSNQHDEKYAKKDEAK